MARTSQPLPVLPSALALAAAALAFVGGRLLDDASQSAALILAIVAALAGGVLRAPRGAAGPEDDGVRLLRWYAAVAHGVLAAGVGLILIFLRGALDGDDARNVALSLGLLSSIGAGAVLFTLELLMAESRASGVVDRARVERAARTAITLVAATGMLGGLVYGVHKSDVRFELAYAAPTSPSGATLAMLDTASCGDQAEKPEVFLFFERGSTALTEVQDYFDALAARGARVQVLDQALDPALSKAVKVTKNGTIAVRCGEKSETWSLGAEREDAQKKLQKLDTEIRTRLGKVTRDPVNVYFTVGHGERSVEESDKTGRASGKGLKKLLEQRNAKPKKLGVADGLSSRVPEDAGVVVVFGPTQPFLDEEARALAAFVDDGGALALFLDPAAPGAVDVRTSLAPLLSTLGVTLDGHEVVNDKEYVKQSGTDADHVFVFSTSFGTHKAVKTLSSARGKAALLFLSAQAVRRADAATADAAGDKPKVSFVARSRPATWSDVDGDRSFRESAGEKRDILDLAAVVEKKLADKEGRALVVGDSDVVADVLLSNEANAVFAWEAFQWLLRDDDAGAADVTVDEDAPIRHTRDEDTAWFYGTTVAMPAVLLLAGTITLRLRRRRRPAAAHTPSPGGTQ